jgi:hypothetical protein
VLNLVTVKWNELIKDREALMYGAKGLSVWTESIIKDREALKFEVENLRGRWNDKVVLQKQFNLATVEWFRIRNDREALIHEALKLEVENL